jgi:hypothetical protein
MGKRLIRSLPESVKSTRVVTSTNRGAQERKHHRIGYKQMQATDRVLREGCRALGRGRRKRIVHRACRCRAAWVVFVSGFDHRLVRTPLSCRCDRRLVRGQNAARQCVLISTVAGSSLVMVSKREYPESHCPLFLTASLRQCRHTCPENCRLQIHVSVARQKELLQKWADKRRRVSGKQFDPFFA